MDYTNNIPFVDPYSPSFGSTLGSIMSPMPPMSPASNYVMSPMPPMSPASNYVMSPMSPASNYVMSPMSSMSPASIYGIRQANIVALEPTDNNTLEILQDIPDEKLPDIGIVSSTLKKTERLDERVAVKDIIEKAKSIKSTFRGYEANMNEHGQLYPFDNPNPQNNYSPYYDSSSSSSYTGPIVLQNHQIDVARRMVYGYLRYPGFLNTGRLGSGKTYLALWLAQYFNFPIFVVSPTTIQNTWKQVAASANIPMLEIITYESLRGNIKTKVKHDYLNRIDETYVDKKGNIVKQVHFTPTNKLLHLLDSGVLFVFDEIQKGKNESAQFYAITAITRAIHKRGGKSRYLLLSGSPIDKAEQVYNLFSIMNITKSDMLNDKGVRVDVREIINKAMVVDVEGVKRATENRKIYDEYSVSNDLVFKIFINVYKPRFVTGMNLPKNNIIADIRNGFYYISPNFLEEWKNGIKMLAAGLIKNKEGKTVVDITVITKAIMAIEKAIVYDMSLRAKFHLDVDPNAKLVLFFNYLDVIKTSSDLLFNYNPVVLTGEIKVDERSKLINRFNDPNSGVRVLVGNITVGGVGINLQDTIGDHPRIMYISPTYNIQNVFQATGRIVRTGSKSPAMVRIFYGHPLYGIEPEKNMVPKLEQVTVPIEMLKTVIQTPKMQAIGKQKSKVQIMFKVFDILARKSEITYTTLDDGSIEDLRMPSNYISIVEGVEDEEGSL